MKNNLKNKYYVNIKKTSRPYLTLWFNYVF